ncbi:MAG: hypothetical protein CSA81_05450 [Acidobacteria bacterium]|nr:MAG: hypothetical protein CSA81_05450 [Acidobacteriota bacterium]PIE90966.1 MAG: hypothetical protein CR997_03660 [Acidobacteriota bacterium]
MNAHRSTEAERQPIDSRVPARGRYSAENMQMVMSFFLNDGEEKVNSRALEHHSLSTVFLA